MQAKKRMVKLIHKIIQSKRRRSSYNNISSTFPKDVAEVLINDNSQQLTDDLITDNIIDLMIPGEDSVPVLITLAVKYLSDSPPSLQQLTVSFNFYIFYPFFFKSLFLNLYELGSQEENLSLKRVKEKLGEALNWSDYLSLRFTQNVGNSILVYCAV